MPNSPSFTIEIHPRKASFDPLAKFVQSELVEAGQPVDTSEVSTQRLFKLTGEITEAQAQEAAETLLVDPIVETAKLQDQDAKKKKAAGKSGEIGWILDVWPKSGVTDPVGETVIKGLRDLGIKGKVEAASAQRYVFPKIKDSSLIKNLAKKILANELIHDIVISRLN